MSLWKSFGGMVEVELTSADIGSTLAAINGKNIRIFGLSAHGELTIRFQIQRKDYRKQGRLCDIP